MLREALQDPNLLDMGDASWIAWRALLLACMGEPLNDEELEHFTKLTGRQESPTELVAEFAHVLAHAIGSRLNRVAIPDRDAPVHGNMCFRANSWRSRSNANCPFHRTSRCERRCVRMARVGSTKRWK